jgi:hypothetical protein
MTSTSHLELAEAGQRDRQEGEVADRPTCFDCLAQACGSLPVPTLAEGDKAEDPQGAGFTYPVAYGAA